MAKQPPPPALLEQYHELGNLHEKVHYSSAGREGVVEAVEVAKRSIEILKSWPEEHWPLKSKEVRDLWPDRKPLIQLFKQAIKEAEAYMGTYSIEDFQKWNNPRMTVFGGLYYFRKKRKVTRKTPPIDTSK
jgi:hypothetical protein